MSARTSQLRGRPDPRRGHLRVVRKNSTGLIKRSRASWMAPRVVTAAIVALALVFGVLLEQIVLAQSAFRLSAIRERMAAAEEKYEKLMREAVLLDNPARIERIARERLGMVEADPGRQKFVVARVHMKHRAGPVATRRDLTAPPDAGAAAAAVLEGTGP